uniref:AMP-dependent synthetase/ligase domain-containing protein n=1 Tax=Fundulus heteroclitus TaxID=8078 RepID=A0A3Q2TWQ6_FUNHE
MSVSVHKAARAEEEKGRAVSERLTRMPARTLQELVSTAASLHAGRVAVLYDSGSGSGSLLYREVAQLSQELSAVLRRSCPSSGVIGLYCRDDLLLPVWILGILQSSAAYVPLDPEAPGLVSARVMSRCGLQHCAVKEDLVQVRVVLFQLCICLHSAPFRDIHTP